MTADITSAVMSSLILAALLLELFGQAEAWRRVRFAWLPLALAKVAGVKIIAPITPSFVDTVDWALLVASGIAAVSLVGRWLLRRSRFSRFAEAR
ncbi:hypothetical protein K7957_03010 [Sphingomonas yunnanensis]|uniref:hypothetical protein n=1 Tax=Sphingomonas yunnanensis TaxID=310400 RepID=UPI001CA61111|nr:hypothetical protein [Sphingomonas yunnanensis]MBY9061897.1 hypothetical protein [Sphingomonas yunnanensis]